MTLRWVSGLLWHTFSLGDWLPPTAGANFLTLAPGLPPPWVHNSLSSPKILWVTNAGVLFCPALGTQFTLQVGSAETVLTPAPIRARARREGVCVDKLICCIKGVLPASAEKRGSGGGERVGLDFLGPNACSWGLSRGSEAHDPPGRPFLCGVPLRTLAPSLSHPLSAGLLFGDPFWEKAPISNSGTSSFPRNLSRGPIPFPSTLLMHPLPQEATHDGFLGSTHPPIGYSLWMGPCLVADSPLAGPP